MYDISQIELPKMTDQKKTVFNLGFRSLVEEYLKLWINSFTFHIQIILKHLFIRKRKIEHSKRPCAQLRKNKAQNWFY